jgi:exosortase D (VPLPA-CTERM-specific)
MNSARIGMTGIAIHQWGTGIAEGFLHLFEGWVIFVACARVLWLEIWGLARLNGRTFFQAWGAAPPIAPSVAHATGRRSSHAMLLAFGALIVTIPIVFLVGGRGELVPDRARFVSFPRTLGVWKGEMSYLEPRIEHSLGLSDYLLADFRTGNGPPVNLYVAYYESQRKGVSPHSPSVCIPGGGWLITKLDRIDVALGGGASVPVNRVVISRNSYRQLVYYWFDQRGRRISSEWHMKWFLLVDALLKRRTDGSLVRLTTQIADDEEAGAADARLVSMMGNLAPALSSYLPH